MIKEIKIENFKSIESLNLELGRLNVFIGANGSGKSNILEAIAFASAAIEDKLDDEYLANRGFRITEPKLLKSGFKKQNLNKEIFFAWSNEITSWGISAKRSNEYYGKWKVEGSIPSEAHKFKQKVIKMLEKGIVNKKMLSELKKGVKDTKEQSVQNLLLATVDMLEFGKDKINAETITKNMPQIFDSQINEKISETANDFLNFIIYAPENSFLRRFEGDFQIKPLGFKGDGLFKLLTVLAAEQPKKIDEINENLRLIEWFDGFEIPKDLKYSERRLNFKDSFLEGGLRSFDQKSVNEGTLFLLFYFVLLISDYTPKFFAIDNIDNALNPKLGSQLIKILAKLAEEHGKQVILTTHNPAILDGLNLNDDMQRLFVISRNAEGHTKALRIEKEPIENGKPNVKLSEQFLRGYIGGLNF